MKTVSCASKRAFLTSASGAAVVAGLGSLAGGAEARAAMSDAERWTREMAALGPRITGGEAHRKWITAIADSLAGLGLRPARHPVPIRYWEATAWSLSVTDRTGRTTRIPVANYVPYAGETTVAGVAASLVDLGRGEAGDYAGKDVRGGIVVVDKDFPSGRSAKNVLGPVLATYPAGLDVSKISFVGQPTVGGGADVTKLLKRAKADGAAAGVVILDLPPGAAAGQFTPHQQPEIGLPALHLDRVQGARLRALMAAGAVDARLVLQARRDDAASADYLSAKLPGNGKHKGAVCLLTHTDGQNAIEENGAAALLSIAKHFSRLPIEQRDRDILFVFSACHMKCDGREGPAEGVSPQKWLDSQPAIARDIAMVFTIEHLGGREWRVGPDRSTYAPTGRPELWILGMTDNAVLRATTADALKTTTFQNLVVTLPPGNLYGEGTSTQHSYPSITTASGPIHLLQLWGDERSAAKLVDFRLMDEQVAFLTRLTGRFLEVGEFVPRQA